ncbi:hypothetical protein CEXT_249961 [Caerostris extrusa]|uniref:Uncharacterized protein n=1 Tax=Caerostris extrusa TaxID=172846 RepID=A0AAV4WSW9_CAEEX|nr:hypothetical protein CEXT_249961 [Caerostris extrusa]
MDTELQYSCFASLAVLNLQQNSPCRQRLIECISLQQAFNSLKLQNIRSFSGQQLKRITNKIQNTRSHKNPAEFNFNNFSIDFT